MDLTDDEITAIRREIINAKGVAYLSDVVLEDARFSLSEVSRLLKLWEKLSYSTRGAVEVELAALATTRLEDGEPFVLDPGALDVGAALRSLTKKGRDRAGRKTRQPGIREGVHKAVAVWQARHNGQIVEVGQLRREKINQENHHPYSDDKRPLTKSQRNIRVALRKLGVTVRYDKFSCRNRIDGLDGFGPGLDDAALDRLWLLIDERFGFQPAREFFLTVTRDAARQIEYHPVAEYLTALRWDGLPRIDKWLATYGGAEDTAFVRAVGEIALIAAVRRVRQPGVKFDEMLVIEGAQGTNKSSALKVLAVSEEWFTDDLPLHAKTQQVIEILSGKWIVEAGELNGIRRSGIDQLKGFLSRSRDKARMAYDRVESEIARQCIIVGTTNDSRYLRDTTGGRRFWPVAVERFDLEALRRDRDQLWAEAAAREAEGASIRLDPALYNAAAAVQDERRVEDPFYERLHSVLGEQIEGKLKTEDAWRLFGKPSGQRTQGDNARLGSAMRRLGFERKQLRFGGNPEYCYLRGDGAKRITLRTVLNGEVEEVVLTDGGPCDPF